MDKKDVIWWCNLCDKIDEFLKNKNEQFQQRQLNLIGRRDRYFVQHIDYQSQRPGFPEKYDKKGWYKHNGPVHLPFEYMLTQGSWWEKKGAEIVSGMTVEQLLEKLENDYK